MNRTIIAILALLPAGQLAAAPPAPDQAPKNAIEERVVNAEPNAQQRELEIHRQVQQQDPKVQADFAVMMEELDRSTGKSAPATTVEAPKPAR